MLHVLRLRNNAPVSSSVRDLASRPPARNDGVSAVDSCPSHFHESGFFFAEEAVRTASRHRDVKASSVTRLRSGLFRPSSHISARNSLRNSKYRNSELFPGQCRVFGIDG